MILFLFFLAAFCVTLFKYRKEIQRKNASPYSGYSYSAQEGDNNFELEEKRTLGN